LLLLEAKELVEYREIFSKIKKAVRILPSEETEGFFIAKLAKL
jgi:16S rRNA C967 or C1407 C5-methylase (RsmB/RsmF family)